MSSEQSPKHNSSGDSMGYDPLEPPIVLPPGGAPLRPAGERLPSRFKNAVHESWQKMRGVLQEKTYGAPRVFDLFTLMSITLAFGLLFAIMKALDAIPEVFVSITCFVTLVALAQMLLYQGNSPRLASVVGGPLAIGCIGIGLAIWYARSNILYGMICLFPIGVPFGYLAGGMIAGVFLLADELRSKFSSPADTEPVSDDDMWR